MLYLPDFPVGMLPQINRAFPGHLWKVLHAKTKRETAPLLSPLAPSRLIFDSNTHMSSSWCPVPTVSHIFTSVFLCPSLCVSAILMPRYCKPTIYTTVLLYVTAVFNVFTAWKLDELIRYWLHFLNAVSNSAAIHNQTRKYINLNSVSALHEITVTRWIMCLHTKLVRCAFVYIIYLCFMIQIIFLRLQQLIHICSTHILRLCCSLLFVPSGTDVD